MFVTCLSGIVNSRHVALITRSSQDADGYWVLKDKDGTSLGRTYADPEEWIGEIIPAQPNTLITAFFDLLDEDGSKEKHHEVLPVLAWRIKEDGVCSPISFVSLEDYDPILFHSPDGHTLIDPNGRTYEDLASAIDDICKKGEE
jgi:hypothetical protein